jgi:ribonucleoside-diphosphate reductase alpha chain
MTGIADAGGKLPAEWLKEGAQLIADMNMKYAKKLDINPAHRLTAIKPEGSASCVVGSSSGVHDRHAEYYIRRVRMNKDDSLYKYLQTVMPDLCEDDIFSSTTGVVSIPQHSPERAITREKSTAIKLLDRAMFLNRNWVAPGHFDGANKNNVSLTVSVKENEWEEVCKYMYEKRDIYTGISLLPYDGGTYQQAPFEDIDKDRYNELISKVGDVDVKQVLEAEDNTDRKGMLSCAGASCEII